MYQTLRATIGLATVLLTASACSPTIHQQKVAQVQRAAIVGFDAQLPPTGMATDAKTQAAHAYDRLASSLEASLGWQMTARSELSSHPVYAASYEQHHADAPFSALGHTIAMLSEDYYPAGIMWSSQARDLTNDERVTLMKKLQIDALAIAHIDVEPCSTHTTEFESRAAYQARLTFEVYDQTSPEPIWTDRWVVGEPSQNALSSDPSQVDASYLQAIEQAYITLFERYESQK